MNLLQKSLSLLTLFSQKKVTTMSVIDTTQTAGAVLNAVNQAEQIAQTVGAVASVIPAAAPVVAVAQTAATAISAVEAAAPAIDSVLSALLPLLRAAGHNIGDEYEHLTAAAKSVAK